MYVCMYVCMYVYIYIHISLPHLFTLSLSLYIYIFTYDLSIQFTTEKTAHFIMLKKKKNNENTRTDKKRKPDTSLHENLKQERYSAEFLVIFYYRMLLTSFKYKPFLP